MVALLCWSDAKSDTSKPTQLLAVLVDSLSKKPVPSARVMLGRKNGTERECTIDASLTATSNDRGEVKIPNVKPGEYVVFYNLSGILDSKLNGLLVKYHRVFNDSYVKTMSEALGPLLVLKGANIGVVESLIGVENGYLHSSRFDVAVIVSRGDLRTVRMSATGNTHLTIEINTDLPGASSTTSPPKAESPIPSTSVTLPTSGAGHEPGETIHSLGLTWQKAPPTQQMKWEEAKAYCASLTAGSWRLPTKDESVAFYTSPSYAFQPADNGWYWAGVGARAWYVSAIGGKAYNDGARNASRVRCVR
jgi:Protein of unknown function (DUF1566)